MKDRLRHFSIDAATFDDLGDIAHLHILSWQQTYRGQIPQDYLDNLDVGTRQKEWEGIFKSTHARKRNLYLARQSGTMAGFISFGPSRDERLKNCGEIYAVYLLEEAKGSGIGYGLFKLAREALRSDGYTKIFAWVLDSNKDAICAYKRWGGILNSDLKIQAMIGGKNVTEVAILFDLGVDQ